MSSTDPPFPSADDSRPPESESPLEVFPAEEEEPLEVLPAEPPEAPARPPIRPRPPHPNFWWALLWCLGCILLVNGVLAAVVIAGLFASALVTGQMPVQPGQAGGGLPPTQGVALLLGSGLLGGELLLAAASWVAIRLIVGAHWRRALAVRPPSLSQAVLALLGLPGMLLFPGAVLRWTSEFLPSFGNNQATLELFSHCPVWFAVLAVGVGPGFAEELFCRGFLGRGLVGHYGAVAGVLLTSVCFGLLHLDPPQVLGTAVLGLWLHYVYLTSRALPLSMFLHLFNNAAAVLAVFSLGDRGAALETPPWQVYAATAALTAAVAWALYDGRARLVATEPAAVPWRPAYPGVELPPPGSGTLVVRPWPRWWCWLAVLAAAALLAAVITLSAA
jgi:membrane protease YdiL (CAAX protease family)